MNYKKENFRINIKIETNKKKIKNKKKTTKIDI